MAQTDSGTRAATTYVAAGSRVIAVVSRGPAPHAASSYVTVPDVHGAEQGSALSRLQESGLETRVFSDYSSRHKRGRVTGHVPAAGTTVPAGTTAVLLVSSGPPEGDVAEVPLPDIVGLSEAEAAERLSSSGLAPHTVHDYSPNVPEGTVIAQLPDPAAATVVRRRPIWPWILGALAVLTVLALLLFWFLGRQADVPDVIGQTQTTAEQAIRDSGLSVGSVTTVVDEDAQAGTVIEQDPDAGQRVRRGTAVNLVVSGESPDVSVPNVVRTSEEEAVAALQAAGLEVEVTRAPSGMVPRGQVISQTPSAGQTVPAGTTVGIVVSEGERVENVQVPEVTGLTRQDAERALRDAGLQIAVAESPSEQVAADVVISQLPAAGESVAPGTTVGIVVSTGPPATGADAVEVPNLVGDQLQQAQAELQQLELQATPVGVAGTGRPRNEVVAQTPGGGESVPEGSTVVLFYSAGQ